MNNKYSFIKIAWILCSLVILTNFLISCADREGILSSHGTANTGNISGNVLTSDDGSGVEAALIQLSVQDSVLDQQYTNAKGEFLFRDVQTGIRDIKVTLPQGFEAVDTLEKSITVDGDKTLEFLANPIRMQTKTVQPGIIDTLATSSGSFIEVDASSSDQSIEVTIEEVENSSDDEFESVTKPVRIWIRPEGQSKKTDGSYGIKSGSASGPLTFGIVVGHIIAKKAFESVNFAYNVGTDDKPITLYTNTESTTYIDPNTGKEETVELHSFDVPSDTNFETVVEAALLENNCDDKEYSDLWELKAVPEEDIKENAQDLILVHGWQYKKFKCSKFEKFDPFEESFKELIGKLPSEIDSKYNFYTYRYPSNLHVLIASDDLYNQIDSQNLQNPVIIGHSMGGLVGRGLVAANEPGFLKALITLGTPHKGSPLADINLDCSIAPTPKLQALCLIGGSIFVRTDGFKDLNPESDLIQNLEKVNSNATRIFSLGGQIHGDYNGNPTYLLGHSIMKVFFGLENDGIVPVQSAIPEWAFIQKKLDNHDHEDIRQTNLVVEQLIPILSDLSKCVAPPGLPDSNEFKLSGTIGREGGRTVRVTLNAISIDGEVITDLTDDNFMVIENGCVKNIQNFSTENVGVDIVFIQDLSGSMDNAIAGVRSSVISFAEELADLGVNAKFASVGYSGPGNIPSSPNTSTCEYLGPFQDLTDVNSFQTHVSNHWFATAGCDSPENGLEAIEYVHENVNWRTGAARVYIDITDVSHHTEETNCNDLGSCTDKNLDSIVELVGETSTIHVVAPNNKSFRTFDGGLDPWKLAGATGGEKLVLPSDGYVDLTTIGVSDIIGEAITFTFQSFSPDVAIHSLRIRAEIDGKVSELAPNLVRYKKLDSSLSDL